MDTSRMTVTPSWSSCGNAPTCTVSVRVAYTFNPLGPISMAIPMASTSLMVISQ
jgi:hypothetical protein